MGEEVPQSLVPGPLCGEYPGQDQDRGTQSRVPGPFLGGGDTPVSGLQQIISKFFVRKTKEKTDFRWFVYYVDAQHVNR